MTNSVVVLNEFQGKQPKDVLHDIDLMKCSSEESNSVQVIQLTENQAAPYFCVPICKEYDRRDLYIMQYCSRNLQLKPRIA